ncbi:hypothetical protein I317_06192 [Kwoniella heveanensis CBS 569]|nr:hypothetical protein I317_06192 [Kwoniella heveanensis CBS 569]
MHSLFSRSGTTPKKGRAGKTGAHSIGSPMTPASGGRGVSTADAQRGYSHSQRVGEFGTVPAVASKTLPNRPTQPLTPPESPEEYPNPSPPPLLPLKYSFLPTRIPTNTTNAANNSVDSFAYEHDEVIGLRQYGFLGGIGGKVTLGLSDVGRVVKIVGDELIKRGLTTPMLFSSQALELSQTRTKMLIQAYLDSLASTSQSHSRQANTFAQEVRFAKEHELAWLLRWALSRITRIKEKAGGKEVVHGTLEWEAYEEWRGRERAASHPTDAFPFLAVILLNDVYDLILTPLFHLLSRFAAHSHLSGLTPHALSSYFAPLLFDIPTAMSALTSHAKFVRAASATEHLLLAYIRSTSARGSLGLADLPFRLKEWVAGYPAMVATDADLARGGPRKGARVVRCERATRTVRAYSKDLIVQAELWPEDLASTSELGGAPAGAWDAWDRVTWKARRGEVSRPKFSAAYRRRMMVKENLPLPSSAILSGLNRSTSYGQALRPGSINSRNDKKRGLMGAGTGGENEEGRWSSLAGKEWSLFEEGGFDAPLSGGGLVDEKKEDIKKRLQFDLTESAKMSISERRRTMDWSEFASPSGGFNRTDSLLDVSLTFAPPVQNQVTDWPKERDELRKRLHKAQKNAVPFNYDTTPRFGANAAPDPVGGARTDEKGRVYIEEAFVDCWADLMMGSSWVERDELTFRDANWVLIEYKAKPSRPDPRQQDADPLGDPRKTELYFLFEERVPSDYQIALVTPVTKKSGFTLFSPKGKKRNAGPNVRNAGGIPHSESMKSRLAPGWDDSDFDKMLLHRSHTKKVSLSQSRTDQPHSSVWHMAQDNPATSPLKPSLRQRQPPQRARSGSAGKDDAPRHGHSRKESKGDEDLKMGETKNIFFGTAKKGLRRVKTDEDNKKKQAAQEMEFELHSASGISSSEPSPRDGNAAAGGAQKGKKDEKWMDILIANGARRMDRQDAELPPKPLQKHTHTGNNLGLPVSPHPPARHGSPNPQGVDPQRTPPQDHGQDPDHTTPRAGPPERQRSIKRKAVPGAIPTTHEPSTSDDDATFEPLSPTSQSSKFTSSDQQEDSEREERCEDHPELLHPMPRRDVYPRDTIHGIVDHYEHNRESSESLRSDLEPVGERESGSYFDRGHGYMTSTSNERRMSEDSRFDVGDEIAYENRPGADEIVGNASGDTGTLEAPEKGMLFDLTSGREPSPARYKHGEPLQFVGEEPEEEEYESRRYR